MRTVRTKVYKFEELSKVYQDRIIEMFRDTLEFNYWQFNEDAEQIGLELNEIDLDNHILKTTLSKTLSDSIEAVLVNHGQECETYKVAFEFKKRLDTLNSLDILDRYEGDDYELMQSYKRGLSSCYLDMLQNQYAYEISEKGILDMIENNEYEFLSDGRLY